MDFKKMGFAVDHPAILNHPAGLFILFFTEMWERFSYYGMRALLVLFLTASLIGGNFGGYGWENESALQLYALYTGLVYFTPLFGGMIADKLIGYRKSVIIGAFVMAGGHLCMALQAKPAFFLGLLLLIVGNGLFKPNISSMVGQLYSDPQKKDGAYTIFYMGINAGAFLGILLCGYIGEKIGWHYGFGLAMIFMVAGALQFWLSGKIFGKIGLAPENDTMADLQTEVKQESLIASGSNSRLMKSLGIGVIIAIFIYLINPIKDWSTTLNIINTVFMGPLIFGAFGAIVSFIILDPSLLNIEKDRLWVIVILTFFTVFFWWAFEQAGGSMTIFARDYTDRNLTGNGAVIFNTFNTLLTVVPMAVITWVLLMLVKKTYARIGPGSLILVLSFVFIWIIIFFMLAFEWGFFLGFAEKIGMQVDPNKTEVQASWFGILNSFFIITFAPLFSKFWELQIIKSGPVKFAMGLILLAIGFALLAWGASSIPSGAESASVSMSWLILAYLFITLGELCLSPVGLSYVSKLAPLRLIGIMFGVFFLSNFMANWAAGMTGSYIDPIMEKYSLSFFFLIFAVIPGGAALLLILIKGKLKKMMHGID